MAAIGATYELKNDVSATRPTAKALADYCRPNSRGAGPVGAKRGPHTAF